MRQERLRGLLSVLGNCGKKRYPHERAAHESADIQMRYASDRGENLRLRIYQCSNGSCRGWHLTEQR